eukprot:TRINITY_DN460_c4_g1_i1.p1 TRINITY_DN460_c4_g1~~TRINITY_DN460_c4_g1_i1.p1  ORF type:complete len:546 (-),score=122.81 TRINITY_DN460_c4_g1_i1:349-1986(-)
METSYQNERIPMITGLEDIQNNQTTNLPDVTPEMLRYLENQNAEERKNKEIQKEKEEKILTSAAPTLQSKQVHSNEIVGNLYTDSNGAGTTMKCPECGKIVTNFKRHMKTHTLDKPFKCSFPECNYSCSRKDHLKKHFMVHTYLPRKLPSKAILKRYQMKGENGNENDDDECTEVPIKTAKKNIIKKKFMCPHCRKELTTKQSLTEHINSLHTGEKPFKCPHCDFAHARRSKLTLHMRKHTGQRPFKCPHCDYSAVKKEHLKHHIYTHTGQKPYECPHCTYAAAQLSTLNSHIEYKHPNAEEEVPTKKRKFPDYENVENFQPSTKQTSDNQPQLPVPQVEISSNPNSSNPAAVLSSLPLLSMFSPDLLQSAMDIFQHQPMSSTSSIIPPGFPLGILSQPSSASTMPQNPGNAYQTSNNSHLELPNPDSFGSNSELPEIMFENSSNGHNNGSATHQNQHTQNPMMPLMTPMQQFYPQQSTLSQVSQKQPQQSSPIGQLSQHHQSSDHQMNSYTYHSHQQFLQHYQQQLQQQQQQQILQQQHKEQNE